MNLVNFLRVWVKDQLDLPDLLEFTETLDLKETPVPVDLKVMQVPQELMEPQVSLDLQDPPDQQDAEAMAVAIPTQVE